MNLGWVTSTLGGFVRLQRGHDLTASEQLKGCVPVMGSAGPNGMHVEARAQGPGVVVGRSGASIGRVHYSEIDYWPHNTCLYVTDFLGNNPRFAYYLLQTLNLALYNSGSAQPSLNRNLIYSIPLRVPPRDEQDQIAAMLRALDDRIALLRETNATLEAIAQALFKSWFVDFDPVRAKQQGLAPAGMDEATAALFPDGFEESPLGSVPKAWRVGTLGDICVNPRVAAKPEHIPADTPYFGLEHMPRRSIALASAGTAAGLESGKFWFERDDVLFGKLRPYFHKVGLAPTRGICSTDILVLRPRTPSLLGFVAMHASSDALIAHTTMLSNGARMPRTSWHDIAGFKVVLPPDEVSVAFNGVARAFFERVYSNIDAARTLSVTRDTLLPRLISGQLRLPEAEALAELD